MRLQAPVVECRLINSDLGGGGAWGARAKIGRRAQNVTVTEATSVNFKLKDLLV